MAGFFFLALLITKQVDYLLLNTSIFQSNERLTLKKTTTKTIQDPYRRWIVSISVRSRATNANDRDKTRSKQRSKRRQTKKTVEKSICSSFSPHFNLFPDGQLFIESEHTLTHAPQFVFPRKIEKKNLKI